MMLKNPSICVYCLKVKPDVSFTKAEHVIPQSFGKFEHNFTLNNCVCDRCNQFFGDELELVLARDSVEGSYRYRFGQRPPEMYQPRKNPRVRYEINEGPYAGFPAWIRFDGSTTPSVFFQPCFRISGVDGEDPQFLDPDELPTFEELRASRGKNNAEFQIKIVGMDLEAGAQLLEGKGYKKIRFGKVGYPERGPIDTETIAKVDAITFRAFGKMAFNYMTHVHGPELALQPNFNDIRTYVRWGTEPPERSTWIDQDPMVQDESLRGKVIGGHLLTLQWHELSKRLIGQVSLYNQFRYTIGLTPASQPPAQVPKPSGHFFNLDTQKIYDMAYRWTATQPTSRQRCAQSAQEVVTESMDNMTLEGIFGDANAVVFVDDWKGKSTGAANSPVFFTGRVFYRHDWSNVLELYTMLREAGASDWHARKARGKKSLFRSRQFQAIVDHLDIMENGTCLYASPLLSVDDYLTGQLNTEWHALVADQPGCFCPTPRKGSFDE